MSHTCEGCGVALTKRPGPGRYPKWCGSCAPASTAQRRASLAAEMARDPLGFQQRHRDRNRIGKYSTISRQRHGRPASTAASDRRRAEIERGNRLSPALRSQVLDRDEWQCFCGEPIDPSLRFPDPRSATIDHVLAVAVFGPINEPWNLRAAHLGCNASKGARPDRAGV